MHSAAGHRGTARLRIRLEPSIQRLPPPCQMDASSRAGAVEMAVLDGPWLLSPLASCLELRTDCSLRRLVAKAAERTISVGSWAHRRALHGADGHVSHLHRALQSHCIFFKCRAVEVDALP